MKPPARRNETMMCTGISPAADAAALMETSRLDSSIARRSYGNDCVSRGMYCLPNVTGLP